MRLTSVLFTLSMICALTVNTGVQAAVLYSGGTYSQDFDSLPATGASIAWTNDSTLAGWSIFRQPAPGTAITTIAATDGSTNTGSFYSFGTVGSSDRALGGIASGGAYFGSPGSGTLAGWWGVGITNSTGSTIDSFTLSYDGEEWRNGGNTSAQTMALQYGFGSSFTAVTTWVTPGGSFDFLSPTVGATAAALDGNAAANRVAGLGGTIGSQTWADGTTLWVRWIENNDPGNDHGLGVDNFQFTAHNVPEPSTIVLGAIGALVSLVCIRRRTT